MNEFRSSYHTPVLVKEVIQLLKPASGKVFIDATLGGGGHTKALAKQRARVLAIDHDPDAIEESKKWLEEYPSVRVVLGSFEHIADIAKAHDVTQVDGILFDLGVSSHQLDVAGRGFSFQKNAPLDMRTDPSLSVTAKDLVNALPESKLTELFITFGEERQAKKIAQAIGGARKLKPIETTSDLVAIIQKSIGERKGGIHSATRVFQALRIAVNSELQALENGLQQAYAVVKPEGIIAVISFHSLEDRIVKRQFKAWEQENKGFAVTKKLLMATVEEQQANPRSRSAKLRACKKI